MTVVTSGPLILNCRAFFPCSSPFCAPGFLFGDYVGTALPPLSSPCGNTPAEFFFFSPAGCFLDAPPSLVTGVCGRIPFLSFAFSMDCKAPYSGSFLTRALYVLSCRFFAFLLPVVLSLAYQLPSCWVFLPPFSPFLGLPFLPNVS